MQRLAGYIQSSKIPPGRTLPGRSRSSSSTPCPSYSYVTISEIKQEKHRHINSSPPLRPTSSMTLRTSASSNIGPIPSHLAIFLSLSQTSPMSTAPERYNGCDCSRSHVALADSRLLSLRDDWRLLLGEVSVDMRPFASLVGSKCCSSAREGDVLDALDEGSRLGSSTNPGGWLEVGDEDAVARRISFSVCARCNMSFNLSLSDCNDDVVVVSRLSFASRSLTCLSLRSRKARCLWTELAYMFAMLDLRCIRCAILSLSS